MRTRTRTATAALLASTSLLGARTLIGMETAAAAPPPPPPRTERISVSSSEEIQSEYGTSEEPAMTPDGRFVVFSSTATNLVPGDTNGVFDVFLRDRVTGTTERISVASDGTEGDGPSYRASITDDGRFVAFSTSASNLGGISSRIYIRDRLNATTTQVVGGPIDGYDGYAMDDAKISGDGTHLAFVEYSGGDHKVALIDLSTGATTKISENHGDLGGYVQALAPEISGDGSKVVFTGGSDFITTDDSNQNADVYLWDQGLLTRVSTGPLGGGGQDPDISADGSTVVFSSYAEILIGLDGLQQYAYDTATQAKVLVTRNSEGEPLQTGGWLGRVSTTGRYVSFVSQATNFSPPEANESIQDVYVRDLATNQTTRRSVASDLPEDANSHSFSPTEPSTDGTKVAFTSYASNLAPGADLIGEDILLNDTTRPVNQPPIAVLSADPVSGISPLTVKFNGGFSSDPDGKVKTYLWDFGDGKTSKGKAPSHKYSSCNGTAYYTVTLTVTDDRGSSRSTTRTIEVHSPLDDGSLPAYSKPSGANLMWKLRGDLGPCVSDQSFKFGLAADKPVLGDWDGDGVKTIGVYRNGTFLLRNSNSAGPADTTVSFGTGSDTPVVGDWDGDGVDTVGVITPSMEWQLRNANTPGVAEIVFTYGVTGDRPVVGDWNGDGTDTPGVVTAASEWQLRNDSSAGSADTTFTYGSGGDAVVAGDWDANGTTDPGVVTGTKWSIRFSQSAGTPDYTFTFGSANATYGTWSRNAGGTGGGGGGGDA